MVKFDPIQDGKSLPQIVVRHIERNIKEQSLRPGDQLPTEKELAEQFAVSRTVIREAMMILRQANVVEVHHGIGTFVAESLAEHAFEQIAQLLRQQAQSLHEVHEVRVVLEPELVAIAIDRITDDELDNLRSILTEMENAFDNLERFIKLDFAFHNEIAMATKNSTFRLILNPVMEVLLEIRKFGSAVEGAFEQTVKDHKEVLEAIEAKDKSKARVAMLRHLGNVVRNVRAAEQSIIEDDWWNKNRADT